MKNKTILVVAAHPDDEILGCGATVAKMVAQGAKAYSLILGEGVTSRDTVRNVKNNQDKLNKLQSEIIAANKILGVKKTYTENLPDNRFDELNLLDIVKKIENIAGKTNPTTVFTHYGNDLNIDHQITLKAVITATRPLPGNKIKEIYAFETLSSTEFNYPLSFSPDTFFDVSDHLEKKIKAMGKYKSELRSFPHPRSLKMIKLNAKYWGVRTGLKYAEAFQTIRNIC